VVFGVVVVVAVDPPAPNIGSTGVILSSITVSSLSKRLPVKALKRLSTVFVVALVAASAAALTATEVAASIAVSITAEERLLKKSAIMSKYELY
jgi:hypothetical protein